MRERIEHLRILIANNPMWNGQLLRDDMPEAHVIMWEEALGIYVPPYVPTFRKVTGTDGMFVWPLPDSDYFATLQTALEMAKRYGDEGTGMTEVQFGGTGGLFTVDAKEYHITVKGKLWNAGLMAAYFKRLPEDTRPGIADTYIRRFLGI